MLDDQTRAILAHFVAVQSSDEATAVLPQTDLDRHSAEEAYRRLRDVLQAELRGLSVQGGLFLLGRLVDLANDDGCG
jgi:hypothetical protein